MSREAKRETFFCRGGTSETTEDFVATKR